MNVGSRAMADEADGAITELVRLEDPRQSERPRVESNHRTQLRRLPLCPLSYGASQGWRTGFEPATTGTTTRGSTS
jgi:hypothetical protein